MDLLLLLLYVISRPVLPDITLNLGPPLNHLHCILPHETPQAQLSIQDGLVEIKSSGNLKYPTISRQFG